MFVVSGNNFLLFAAVERLNLFDVTTDKYSDPGQETWKKSDPVSRDHFFREKIKNKDL